MKNYWLFLSLTILILLASCRDDFETIPSSGDLSFSKDTIYLDTVFTNIGSSTYNLKVYNKSGNDINIPRIELGLGENSNYRLNVDGVPGKSFQDVEILAKDSLYIFVETTIDYNNVTDPLYIDEILFDNGENLQDVHLVTLVQDANFLFPSKNAQGIIETISLGTDSEGESIDIQGFYLDDNTTFTDEKPYVIYGYLAVPEDKTLTIEAGTKLHFHANSGLIVDKNASLKINGELENQVLIEGDRLEPEFSNIPGQWGAIWLRAGSKDHEINYATIKNGDIGILLDSIGSDASPTLTIKNSKIYNQSNYGILGRETNIMGENIVINNAGQSSLACTIGGTYNFTHSTFANYWNNSLRQFPTVLINNFFTYIDNGAEIVETRDLFEANFTNCIIYGSSNIELILDNVQGSMFNYNFKNNLLKFDDYNNSLTDIPEYDFSDLTHFQGNIFNELTDFKDPYENELIIGEESAGINMADAIGATQVTQDILGVNRITNPDIGAYQHIIFVDED
ncbi:hypothetical protein [Urechidicola croceus]|uniref:Right handed beta helix domain-containing protein n=1 Tax=Urechidicola croceus TaxID=1850246 RepID=A0A1D8P6U9_9FLAO|nr:hypothetical protein [Urechidicola croceus]AOW20296.1 hypothetical protein LPB138_06215 [Urechidicola croceus]